MKHTEKLKTGGYSREFFVIRGKGRRYVLDAIPPALWTKVAAKCKAEKVSVRALILGWFTEWVKGDA